MLVKKLIPFKFIGLMIEIILAGLLLATKSAYTTANNTSESR